MDTETQWCSDHTRECNNLALSQQQQVAYRAVPNIVFWYSADYKKCAVIQLNTNSHPKQLVNGRNLNLSVVQTSGIVRHINKVCIVYVRIRRHYVFKYIHILCVLSAFIWRNKVI